MVSDCFLLRKQCLPIYDRVMSCLLAHARAGKCNVIQHAPAIASNVWGFSLSPPYGGEECFLFQRPELGTICLVCSPDDGEESPGRLSLLFRDCVRVLGTALAKSPLPRFGAPSLLPLHASLSDGRAYRYVLPSLALLAGVGNTGQHRNAGSGSNTDGENSMLISNWENGDFKQHNPKISKQLRRHPSVVKS